MIELRLGAARTRSDRIFSWSTDESRCSFRTNIDPHLRALGPPDPIVGDLVRLATLVYLADRTRPRPTFGWGRSLQLALPVSDPARWTAIVGQLTDMLAFLSGDDWAIDFRELASKQASHGKEIHDVDVLLFSGGADAQAGAALHSVSRPQLLVSVWEQGGVKGVQRDALQAIRTVCGAAPDVWSIHLSRRERLEATGANFEHEPSSRTRSFAYIAYGVAAASLRGRRLVIAENGFMSLNPPLLPERRGSLSTRTTHPAFIAQMRDVMAALGIEVQLALPFTALTKGEAFGVVRDRYGAASASRLLSATHSCAKPNRRETGVPPMTHCGVCYACLVRRGAFLASGVEDGTRYRESEISGADRDPWLRSHGADLRAVRAGIRRGIGESEVVALALPPDADVDAAYDLVTRGLRELELAVAAV